MRKLLAVAAFGLAAFAGEAAAQVAVQPGTIVGTFQASMQLSSTSINNLYTAPADRHARITDIVVLNESNAACLAAIIIPGGAYIWLYPAPGATTVIPLNSGIGVTAGSAVQAYASTCASNVILLWVRGFNFTIP